MTRRSSNIKRWARWLATFIGFPAAGVAARLVVGDVDDIATAALGGLAGGLALGAVQVLVGGVPPGVGFDGPRRPRSGSPPVSRPGRAPSIIGPTAGAWS